MAKRPLVFVASIHISDTAMACAVRGYSNTKLVYIVTAEVIFGITDTVFFLG